MRSAQHTEQHSPTGDERGSQSAVVALTTSLTSTATVQ